MIKELFITTMIFSGFFIASNAIVITSFLNKTSDKENFKKTLALTSIINVTICVLLLAFWITPLKDKNYNTSKETTTTIKNVSLTDAGFNKISLKEYKNLVKGNEKSIILIARPTCGYCEKFTPILKQSSEDLDLKINYLNTDELSQSEMNEFEKSFDFGDWGTPMVLIVQNGNLIDKNIGYTTLENINSFFSKNLLGN